LYISAENHRLHQINFFFDELHLNSLHLLNVVIPTSMCKAGQQKHLSKIAELAACP